MRWRGAPTSSFIHAPARTWSGFRPSAATCSTMAFSNLLLVSGNYMRPGTGAYPLRGHNNVQGASDNGSMPNFLPGYQPIDDPEVRARFETGWKVKLPSTKGLDNH